MMDLLRILVAPVVWLASFSAVYGLLGILCATNALWTHILLIAAFGLAVFLQVGLLAMLRSRRFGAQTGFVRHVSLAGGWVGLVATVWTLLPILATTACR